MSVQDVAVTVTIAAVQCGTCGTWFGLDAHFRRLALQDGRKFYCPNGHYIGWSDTENAKLQRDLKLAQQRIQYAKEAEERASRRAVSAEMSRRVTKGHLTRIRQRVGGGVCPKCNRTFRQLAAHMQCKHPDFGRAEA